MWNLIKTWHHGLHTFRERLCSTMFKSPCRAKHKIYITLEYHMANDWLDSMSGRGQVLPARGCNLISCYKSNRRLLFIWNLEQWHKNNKNSEQFKTGMLLLLAVYVPGSSTMSELQTVSSSLKQLGSSYL